MGFRKSISFGSGGASGINYIKVSADNHTDLVNNYPAVNRSIGDLGKVDNGEKEFFIFDRFRQIIVSA